MHSTKIVTSFVTNNGRFLLLKRSEKVRSMKCLWAGVSGILERNETPLERAKTEIFEEAGIAESEMRLLKSAGMMRISSPQYKNHQWAVFPFLFETTKTAVRLNWENSDFRWVRASEISGYNTVPSLQKVLFRLL